MAGAAVSGYDVSMSRDPDRRRSEQAQEILRNLERDSVSFLTDSLRNAQQKLASHFDARDAGSDDAAEKWGRRIGRALGLVFFVVLVANLFTGWFF